MLNGFKIREYGVGTIQEARSSMAKFPQESSLTPSGILFDAGAWACPSGFVVVQFGEAQLNVSIFALDFSALEQLWDGCE